MRYRTQQNWFSEAQMDNIVEMDIHYLTGQAIDFYPVRARLTVQFPDRDGVLTHMLAKLEAAREHELDLMLQTPPSGILGFFHGWSVDRLSRTTDHLHAAVTRKAEKLLRRALDSGHNIKKLVRGDDNKSEFTPMDKSQCYDTLELLQSHHRLFDANWVTFSTRILSPEKKLVNALV